MKYFLSALICCCLLTGTAAYGQSDTPISQGSGAYISAYVENKLVVIRWRVYDEMFTDHYTIERSTDNVNFSPLHDIVAQGGVNGDYSYEDGDSYPSSKVNFYRIKTVDSRGNISYSPVVETDRPGRRPPVLRPTVLHMGGTLHITDAYYSQPLTINFFNRAGTQVGSFLVNSTDFDIPSASWDKGMYFYRVSDATHPLIDAGKIMVL